MKTFRIYGKKGYIGEYESSCEMLQLSDIEERSGNRIWGISHPTHDATTVWLEQTPSEIGIDKYGTIWIGKCDGTKILWPEISPSDEVIKIATEVADVLDGFGHKALENYVFRVLWTDHSTCDITLKATDLSDAIKQFRSKYGYGNNAKWLRYQIINHEYVLN
jgi:hypothetical protein